MIDKKKLKEFQDSVDESSEIWKGLDIAVGWVTLGSESYIVGVNAQLGTARKRKGVGDLVTSKLVHGSRWHLPVGAFADLLNALETNDWRFLGKSFGFKPYPADAHVYADRYFVLKGAQHWIEAGESPGPLLWCRDGQLSNALPAGLSDNSLSFALNCANRPFRSFREFCSQYFSLPRMQQGDLGRFIRVAAPIPVRICADNGSPSILIGPTVNRRKIRLGVISRLDAGEMHRTRIGKAQIDWEATENGFSGKFELPNGIQSATLIVQYDERVVEYFRYSGPKVLRSLLPRIHQAFDPGFEELKRGLAIRGSDPKEFDLWVTNLFDLLGFSVLRYSGSPVKIFQDNVDAIVVHGDSALPVECTTGLPTKDGKLDHLFRRSQELRRQFPDKNVQPVLITSLERAAISIDSDALQRTGVSLLCYEDLLKLLEILRQPLSGPEEALEFISALVPRPQVGLEGLFTSAADE